MGKSYISVLSHEETLSQKPELWLHDSYASVLSVMMGIELLTDGNLGDWAAIAGRKCLMVAVIGATGCVDPRLDKHNRHVDRLQEIGDALTRVLLKLKAYGDIVPGRYFWEHNMLLPGEPVPDDLPNQPLLAAVSVLKEEVAQLMALRHADGGTDAH